MEICLKLVSHQTISPPTKKSADFSRKKKSADFFTDFFVFVFVNFFVTIGGLSPIWVSHSPTIIEFKELFSASFKYKTLM